MSQVSERSPELGRGVLQLARAIVAATQQWSLDPPDGRGDYPRAVVEAVDSDPIDIDPLTYL